MRSAHPARRWRRGRRADRPGHQPSVARPSPKRTALVRPRALPPVRERRRVPAGSRVVLAGTAALPGRSPLGRRADAAPAAASRARDRSQPRPVLDDRRLPHGGASRDHPLLDVLANLTRERLAERLLLGPFSRSDAAALVSGMIGAPVAPMLLDAIHRTTEGTPSSSRRSSATWRRRRGFSVEHGVRALELRGSSRWASRKVCARSSDGGSRG